MSNANTVARPTVKTAVDTLVDRIAAAKKVDDKTARAMLGVALRDHSDTIFAAVCPEAATSTAA